jgi:ATP-dependent protease ClpP protease subunit
MADAGSPYPTGDSFPPGPPEFPRPARPGAPGIPDVPAAPGAPGTPGIPEPGRAEPSRVWLDPDAAWQDKLRERLLSKRIVLASGLLDDDAAARVSAQLLALDADGGAPIRLEMQKLRAELSAALTVMGVLGTVRSQVRAYASGETHGEALGVLASCPRREAYPNAVFTLAEPRLSFGGTVTAVTAREEQARRMTDSLYYAIAEATGREADEIRQDARRGRSLTVAEALGYGLIHARVARTDAGPR